MKGRELIMAHPLLQLLFRFLGQFWWFGWVVIAAGAVMIGYYFGVALKISRGGKVQDMTLGIAVFGTLLGIAVIGTGAYLLWKTDPHRVAAEQAEQEREREERMKKRLEDVFKDLKNGSTP
jgi:hypothetical protein